MKVAQDQVGRIGQSSQPNAHGGPWFRAAAHGKRLGYRHRCCGTITCGSTLTCPATVIHPNPSYLLGVLAWTADPRGAYSLTIRPCQGEGWPSQEPTPILARTGVQSHEEDHAIEHLTSAAAQAILDGQGASADPLHTATCRDQGDGARPFRHQASGLPTLRQAPVLSLSAMPATRRRHRDRGTGVDRTPPHRTSMTSTR